MDFFSTNLFDLAIYVCLFVAVVMGFMTGLLRSLATIFGYMCGMGVAVAAAPKTDASAHRHIRKCRRRRPGSYSLQFFVAAGAAISALLRLL